MITFMTKFVCISDTHCKLSKIEIPDGDVLLHAGDLTFRGDIDEIAKELHHLGKIATKFSKTILVPGNHDFLAERNPSLMKEMCEEKGITYLQHDFIEYGSHTIFGSGFTPEFGGWALNVPRGEELKEKWSQIPDNTSILVTHGPPKRILDFVPNSIDPHVGDQDLYNRIQDLKQLKLHVFGHIHYSYGSKRIGETTFINASSSTEQYKPLNPPIIYSL